MDWQLTASLVLVLLACCYLFYRGWRLYSRKKNSAGGCGSCSAEGAKKETVVGISLDKLGAGRRGGGKS